MRCMAHILASLIPLIPLHAVSLIGGEFQADENTLLLANFEKNTKHADYSVGPAAFSGTGASLVDGYHGKGLLLKPLPLTLELLNKCEDTTPAFTGWGPLLDGNIRPEAGTLECFVKVSPPGEQDRGFMVPMIARNIDDGKYYSGFSITLRTEEISWVLPIWGNDSTAKYSGRLQFKKISGFKSDIVPDWHHFALTWANGEAVIYLDGRIVQTFDLKDKLGLAIMNNARQFFNMAGCTIDDLRISNIARYTGDFEPDWQDGKRPGYAFPGNPEAQRHPATYLPPPKAECYQPAATLNQRYAIGSFNLCFDQNGQLLAWNDSKITGSGHGLVLHEGFARYLVLPVKSSIRQENKSLYIEQDFADRVRALNRLTDSGTWIDWDVELSNFGDNEIFLEAVLSLPVSLAMTKEYFDGLEPRNDLRFGRYRDSYPYVLPLGAVSDDKQFAAVGLNPQFPYNDLIHGFQPGNGTNGYIQQGTRIALSPGEKFTIHFVLTKGETEFGTAEALEQYYQRFADLYHLSREYCIYNYMPHTSHRRGLTCEDILRTGYAGSMWGHGPYHTKGDETGKWWNMEKYKNTLSYKHALGWEKICETPEKLHENIAIEYKMEFDNGYPLRRYHACPNLTPEWIIEEVWPGYRPQDDMLVSGNYYKRSIGNYFVNEYDTPLGKHFMEETGKYFEYGMKDNSPGWINDVTYVVAHCRFNDGYAKKTSGRSFAPDMGTFIRGAMGLQQRNELIKSLYSNGYRCSMSWDCGCFSYTTGAHSSSSAIESGSLFETLTGLSFIPYARNLHGQKPVMAHTFTRGIKTGDYIKSGNLDMQTVREYFRYASEQLVLFCLKYGLELDPAAYLEGNQYLAEMTPLNIDNIIHGMHVVPGGTVPDPLWIKRSGDGLNSLIIVGNEKPIPITGELCLKKRYWGASPLLINYFGGELSGCMNPEETILKITAAPREVLAYNFIAMIRGNSKANWKSSMEGDGLNVKAALKIDSSDALSLELNNTFPLYHVAEINLNGKILPGNNTRIDLPSGGNAIIVTYQCSDLQFSSKEWESVELFKNGQANFQIIADPGYFIPPYKTKLGFEHGTAAMLQNFVIFYDWEDGLLDNLKVPEIIASADRSYPGWVFRFIESDKRGVTINPSERQINISGSSHGERRRAMVVFLRLLDRKYPHVGTFYPLKSLSCGNIDRKTKIDFNKIIDWRNNDKNKATSSFFANLPDKEFLLKPLLNRQYDKLYEQGVTDFTGRYQMRVPVFLFEPTYNDNFVYGYKADSALWQQLREKKQAK